MSWGAIGGAAVSAVGGYLSSKGSGKKQSTTMTPWSVDGGLGSIDVNQKKKEMSMALSPEMQGYANLFSGLGQGYLGGWGSETAPFQDFAFGNVQGSLPGLFQQYLGASGADPYSYYGRFDNQMGGLAGQINSGANAMMGAGYGQMGAGQNLLGFGMDALRAGGIGGGMANEMAGYGRQFLGAAPQSYDQVYQDRLSQLRAASAPFEERAGLALQQNLFNTGRLGTTGGSQNVEAFARGLGQADTQRSLDAMGFAEQLYGRDQQAALARNQMGAGLFSGALGGLQSGYGMAGNLAGMGADIYGQGAGTIGAATGMRGSYLPGIFGGQLEAGQGYNTLLNDRALARLGAAQQLFGFGTALRGQDLATGSGQIQNILGLYGNLLEQGKLSANLAGGQTSTSNNTSLTGAAGGFLQGLGGSMGNINWGGLFGGKSDPTGGVFDKDTLKLTGLGG